MEKSAIQKLMDYRIKRLEVIRVSIGSNIETISEMIEQASEIAKVVDTVDDEKTKKNLEEIRGHLDTSIIEMLETTNKLFDAYKDIVESFG